MSVKLRIRRNHGHCGGWSLEHDGVFVGWQITFRRACHAAAEWIEQGLFLTSDRYVR